MFFRERNAAHFSGAFGLACAFPSVAPAFCASVFPCEKGGEFFLCGRLVGHGRCDEKGLKRARYASFIFEKARESVFKNRIFTYGKRRVKIIVSEKT